MLKLLVSFIIISYCTVACDKDKESLGQASGPFEIVSADFDPSLRSIEIEITKSEGAVTYFFGISQDSTCIDSEEINKNIYRNNNRFVTVTSKDRVRLSLQTYYTPPGVYVVCVKAYRNATFHDGDSASCGIGSWEIQSPPSYAKNNGLAIDWPHELIPVTEKKINYPLETPPLEDYKYGFQKLGNLLVSVTRPHLYSLTTGEWSLLDQQGEDSVFLTLPSTTNQVDIALVKGNTLSISSYDDNLTATPILEVIYPENQSIVGLGKVGLSYWLIESDGTTLSYRTFEAGVFSEPTAISGLTEKYTFLIPNQDTKELFPIYFRNGQPHFFYKNTYITILPQLEAIDEFKDISYSLMPITSFSYFDLIYRTPSFTDDLYYSSSMQAFLKQVPKFCSPLIPPIEVSYHTKEFPSLDLAIPKYQEDLVRFSYIHNGFLRLEDNPIEKEKYIKLEGDREPVVSPVFESNLRVLWDNSIPYILNLEEYSKR